MSALSRELGGLVSSAVRRLRELPEPMALKPPAPGKWSPAQVIGHLVDSAIANQQRFLRAALQEELVFPGYDQDAWVDLQLPETRDWGELLDLWLGLNRHLAHVIGLVPDEVLRRERRQHNLHEIAWESLPADRPATLEYFVRDYLNHMRHHLRQIDPALADAPQPQLDEGHFKSR